MRKRTGKLLSVMLAASLVMSLGPVSGSVFAEEAETTEAVTEAVTEAAEAEAAETEAAEAETGAADEMAAGGAVSFTPGTYDATAQGFGPDGITVTVTVSENEILSVDIVGDSETPALGGVAVAEMGAKMVEAQTPNVDGVSGASVSSGAIIAAATEALEAAGADIAALDANRKDSSAEPVEKTEETLTTDIVIVGAGGAGMTAAIKATQAGKDVILLEKMSYAGGNTTKATGGMNAAETHYQEEQGIEDSVEQFVEDTMEGGHNINDIDLVTTLRRKLEML